MYFNFILNAFDDDFCNLVFNIIDGYTFEKAQVDFYGEKKKLQSIRNNFKVEFLNEIISKKIDSKIKLIENFPFTYNSKIYEQSSPALKCYIYELGQYFKPHKDGVERNDFLRSQITCLIYLNTPQGGQTVLMPDGFSEKETHIKITPQKGSMLIFDHKFWHESLLVSFGKKFVLRTNLMYF